MKSAFSPFIYGALLVSAVCLLTACLPATVVPDLDTARDQFSYALSAEVSDIPPVNYQRRIIHRKRQRVKYEKVIERFPDDPIYTPEAIIAVSRMLVLENRFKNVVRYLEKARSLYPTNEFFQARSLYYIGQARDSMQKHEDAKLAYKECMDRFHLSRNRKVREVATECQRLYFRAYINVK